MGKETEILYLDEESLEAVVEKTGYALENWGICIIPTDTIYGIVALDRFKESVNEIYQIKERPPSKPFIRLIGNLDNLKAYTNQSLPETLRKYWPGPLTVIFRGIHNDKISIRFPADEFLQRLFKRVNYGVIVAPSANPSGEADIFESDQLIEIFYGRVDVIVCKKESLKKKKPSTIIDISEHKWRVIREGALTLDDTVLGRIS
ncbi:MAG: L-threonylcarbamoyladenylate synthase [Spirochaetota bacterium]|nr:MAG: L-threonylcarbamoyladenylate synthase [Spirochaetota bacterium]